MVQGGSGWFRVQNFLLIRRFGLSPTHPMTSTFNANGLPHLLPTPVDSPLDNKAQLSSADMLSGLLLEVDMRPLVIAAITF